MTSTFKLDHSNAKPWLSLLLPPDSYISRKVISLSHRAEDIQWKKRLQDAGVPSANEIFTYTNQRELKALYTLAENSPEGSHALEIGSHLGASSCYIAAGLKKINGHLFCVDTWQNETMPEGEQDTSKLFQQNIHGVKENVTPVKKMSYELNDQDIQCPLSLIFIDGDHSYKAVKQDFEHVQKWLAKDGIIAFHDFSNPDFEGVSRVVGEALASGKWMIVGKVDTLVWIKAAKWSQPRWL